MRGATFEILDLGSRSHPGVAALRERWRQGIPVDAFRELLQQPSTTPQGYLIDDLPGVIARALGKGRDELPPGVPESAVYALVPVEGEVRYAVSATGPGLDATVASAFGLFGQQLGAILETLRRMDELARSNRELLGVSEVARASSALGSGESLTAALERVALLASLSGAILLRREEQTLVLAARRGLPGGPIAAVEELETGTR